MLPHIQQVERSRGPQNAGPILGIQLGLLTLLQQTMKRLLTLQAGTQVLGQTQ